MLEIDPFLSAQGLSLRGPSEGRGDQRSQPSARIVSGGEATGGVTWTVPLEVTVRLGAAAEVPASGGPSPAGGLVPGPDEEQELREALEELERARQRVYYDAEADGEARETYYADIDPSVTPKTMFRHLSKLVRATHTEHPRYRPRRYVYPWVDLHPDHKLRSIYSGVAYEPETFIREDFRISQERALRLQEWMAMESTRDTERLQKEIRLLEARLPYNCEHVVPQSWFEGREPMRGDLHHLFACESGCNSFRGNRAYFDFADFEEALRDECGKLMENKFEPSAGKGAAARATLYFLLRYPGEISGDEIGLTEERLPLMLEWHAAFPVTEYERHRNWAIFEEQGNRNPLIDHPEWAAKIDFTRGFDC
jgi:endonuclease I